MVVDWGQSNAGVADGAALTVPSSVPWPEGTGWKKWGVWGQRDLLSKIGMWSLTSTTVLHASTDSQFVSFEPSTFTCWVLRWYFKLELLRKQWNYQIYRFVHTIEALDVFLNGFYKVCNMTNTSRLRALVCLHINTFTVYLWKYVTSHSWLNIGKPVDHW